MKISIKTILKEMPKDLTDIEKVRYIYLKLGEKFAYLREYLYLPERIAVDVYEDPLNVEMIESGNYQNKIKTTCVQMANVFVEAINKIPKEMCNETILAKTVGYRKEEERHVAELVNIGDKSYFFDFYRDIYKIQKGLKTNHFAPSNETLDEIKSKYETIASDLEGINCVTISEKEIEDMDRKLNYSFKGIYMDDVFSRLREEMQKEENWKEYIPEYENIKDEETRKDIIAKWKIDYMFKYLKNNPLEENKMEILELGKFYKKMYHSVLTEEEQNRFKLESHSIYTKRENIRKEESVLYEIKSPKETIYYIYNNEEKGVEKISKKELRKRNEENKLDFCIFGPKDFYEDDGKSR